MSINVSTRVLATLALLVAVTMVGVVVPAAADGPESTDVFTLPPGPGSSVVGDAQLVRTPNGISMNLRTTELEPGAAYTVWWGIFNNPDACAQEICGPGDLMNPDVQGSAIFAAGHVVGSTGQAAFAGYLAVGDTDRNSFIPGPVIGLLDSMAAQIHLIVRTHGPVIPGMVYEQISTAFGGCDINFCANEQVAVFP